MAVGLEVKEAGLKCHPGGREGLGEESPFELESSGGGIEEEDEDEEEGEVTPPPHSPPPEDLLSLGDLFS
jgi:hypothetical protein